MVNIGILIGIVFLGGRISLLGTERIFLSKNQLGKYNSVVVASLFFGFASILLLPGLLLVPPNDYTIQTFKPLLFSLLSSLIYSVGFYSYVKALSQEDASLIAPLYNSSLLWLLILSAVFLPDSLTVTRISGGLVMFLGFFFLYSGSLKEKLTKIRQSKASLLMISGSMFLAIGRTIDAYAVNLGANEILYAISMNFFVGVYLFVLVIFLKKTDDVKKILSQDKLTMLYGSICNGWAYLFLLTAILYLQVTIAEPASLLSVFVTAYLAKKYLQENVKERLPGIIIMLIGALLLFWNIL